MSRFLNVLRDAARGLTSIARRAAAGAWRLLRPLAAHAGRGLLRSLPRARAWWHAGGPRRLVRAAWRPALVRVPILAACLALPVLVGLGGLAARVPAGRIGVRQVDWGPQSGIEPRDYASGLHWVARARSSWHWIDGTTRFLRFAWESEGGEFPLIELRTQEGNAAQLAVTVPYRVRAGEAHRIVREGAKATYAGQAKSVVQAALLREFAGCRSQDLYSTDLRAELAARSLARMNEELRALHVEALAVHVSGVWFPATFEKKLQELQLEGQDRLTRDAQRALEDVAWRMKLVEEEIARAEALVRGEPTRELEAARWRQESELAALRRETDAYVARQRAAGDAEHARASAAGALALDRARAEGERRANQALDSAGGRLLLAREAAASLSFGSVTLDSSDPRVPSLLDLDEMVELLIGSR